MTSERRSVERPVPWKKKWGAARNDKRALYPHAGGCVDAAALSNHAAVRGKGMALMASLPANLVCRSGRSGEVRSDQLSLWQARLACMIFFAAPGLAYGLFVSRVPALTMQVQATADEFGMVLLCIGIAAVAGLAIASYCIGRFGAKTVLLVGCALALGAVCAAGLASSVWQLALMVLLSGFGMGLLDVAMNVQGVEVERQYNAPSMNLLHAGYNIGAFSGSILGSLFAAAQIGPFVNFLCPSLAFVVMLVWATPRLLDPQHEHLHIDSSKAPKSQSQAQRARGKAVPLWVYGWGLLAMISYVVEGSSGEWGSLFVYQEKQAPESIAALVYGMYSICALTCRLGADRLRTIMGDFRLMFVGSLVALSGMIIVLVSPWWPLCLAGYAVLGTGLAPVVPLLFSLASKFEGISVEKATSVIAMCAYCGLLAFPPTFGFLAEHVGLTASLSLAALLLVVLAVSSFGLMRRHRA